MVRWFPLAILVTVYASIADLLLVIYQHLQIDRRSTACTMQSKK